jgi:hypothetical protein
MGISNTPPIAWTKIIQSMVFIKYLHEGIIFLLGLIFFFGVKKVFLFECKIRINFLIISSNIHIRICENVFLTINTRCCIMKVKCFKLKNMDDICYKNVQKMIKSRQPHPKMGNML